MAVAPIYARIGLSDDGFISSAQILVTAAGVSESKDASSLRLNAPCLFKDRAPYFCFGFLRIAN